MQALEHFRIHLVEHRFTVERIRAGAVIAEVHVELATPGCVVRTGFAVILLQTDLPCTAKTREWLSDGLFDDTDIRRHHFSPFVLRPPGSHFVTPAPRFTMLRSVLGGSLIIC